MPGPTDHDDHSGSAVERFERIAQARAESRYPYDDSDVRTLYGFGFGDEDAVWGRGL